MTAAGYAAAVNETDRATAQRAHQDVLDAEAALDRAIERRNKIFRELRARNPQRGYVSELASATATESKPGLHRTVVQRILRGPVSH